MPLPASKITDSRKDLEKAYHSIDHDDHGDNPNRLQTLSCKRCKFNRAEKSLEDKIKDMNTSHTTKDQRGVNKMIKMLTVKRGKLDDCIGWIMEWQ